MSTAPMLPTSPLALLVEAAVKPAPRTGAEDPYARWHGFMEGVVRNCRGVAGVANRLAATAVQPAWTPPGTVPLRPGRRR